MCNPKKVLSLRSDHVDQLMGLERGGLRRRIDQSQMIFNKQQRCEWAAPSVFCADAGNVPVTWIMQVSELKMEELFSVEGKTTR